MNSMRVEGFDLVTRHLVMRRDLNAADTLFGGIMLSWLDEATAIYVMEQIGYIEFVTAGMDDMNFRAPGHAGDVISFYSRIARTGNSSVTAETKAFVEDSVSGTSKEVITCTLTYVCLKDQKPYAYFKSRRYREWLKRKEL